jgi:TetR/AcrR family transcriptional regulator, transcriptional repressor for nem operon
LEVQNGTLSVVARPKEFDTEVAVARAVEVFWRKGYAATSPADLVDALGVGKGSLYNTFSSKHALFLRVLRRYGDERVAKLEEVLTGPGTVKARLEAALERLAALGNADLLQQGCLAVKTAGELRDEDDAMTVVRATFDRMERALQATIEEGQRKGEIGADRTARELASLFVTTILGLTVIATTSDRTGRIRRTVRALVKSI